jgi:hypothetical protein
MLGGQHEIFQNSHGSKMLESFAAGIACLFKMKHLKFSFTLTPDAGPAADAVPEPSGVKSFLI